MSLPRRRWVAFYIVLAVFGIVIAWTIREARYAAVQSAYGGRRMTREQAREIRQDDSMIDWLPDSEFLPSKSPHDRP